MSSVAAIADELRTRLGSAEVRTGAGLEAYRLGRGVPQAAALPRDEAGVAGALRFASEAGLGVVPWGHGSYQSIGLPPSRYDLALDLRGLDRLVAHEPADMTTTAQAGIRFGELQSRLAAHGQFIALDPPLAGGSTLGGVLATRSCGPLRCRYGTARDLVLGLRIAHPDGTVTKAGASVVKNATGYDVTKLHLGAHGTLGVILEATLRVYPRPEVEQGWWIGSADGKLLQDVADRILTSSLVPDRVEFADPMAARTWGAPAGGPALFVNLGGIRESVAGQALELRRIVEGQGGTLVDAGVSPLACTCLGEFPWSVRGSSDGSPWAIWRGGVLPAESGAALGALRRAVAPLAEIGAAATVAHGALRGVLRAASAAHLAQALEAARTALAARGGYLVVLDASVSIRDAVEPWGIVPEGLDVMRRLKQAFDPRGVLNPGRLVGGI
jgi:glycolate oxidase FAD binding subunit